MKTNVYAVFGVFFPLPFTKYRIHQIFAALLPLLNFADLNRRINPPTLDVHLLYLCRTFQSHVQLKMAMGRLLAW